ncbi:MULTISPECIES: hypothetical protein [Bacillus]|uniref:hypothetical protein n=1 Tax=Bacillus TaxID=1386 RepID=UPI000625EDE2|nr:MULTISPECIES: hypothetical protein [Bacillus]KKK08567.1 hypothetical protein UF15_16480 [Bacillus sp. L_1B0_12]KQU13240.1 hypothetical protein ASG46_03105 [Bacillus sp. Leaf49]MCY7621285.1 hypothetical protein [Bacillus altitudinis]MDI6559458.1 hypothetical protein [Bacillus altitudinis]MED0852167.1 hypothetical protein [Bacillus altitudinis]
MVSEVFNDKYKKFVQKKLGYFSEINFTLEEDKLFNTKLALKELKDISWGSHEKIFILDIDIFYKALSSEIIGFYRRVKKQLLNVKKLNDEFDYTWNFVSEYYLSFFLITTLTRFNGEFTIYLYEEEAEEISTIATVYAGEPLKINQGQYVLKIIDNDYEKKEVTVSLKSKRDTHASAWDLFYSFLRNYRSLVNNTDTHEDNILAVLQQFFSEKNNILSVCRNELNYKYQFGYDEINHHRVYESPNWDSEFDSIQKEILKLPSRPDIEDCVKSIIIINYFLIELLKIIYTEFTKKVNV